ncbi:MAG TPA: SDR family NAD(P)-dependent oxidoreductase [Lacipirellulaceae bacterium]|nr:SDR family NAD(P)-dependent oxidoreductase [Lacipirellulaceae bacterium]
MQRLSGKVAVVTGASRGAGRAIAAVLGEAGATVYVTGRTIRGGAAVDGLPGTIEDTAEEVMDRGRKAEGEQGALTPALSRRERKERPEALSHGEKGKGIAVRCDHTNDKEVEALFERVRVEQGRLDLLVNNVWGGYEGQTFGIPMGPFWEQPRGQWESMFVAGVRAHLVASQLGARVMIGDQEATKHPQPGPLPDGNGERSEPSPGPSLQGRGSPLIVSTVAWAYDEYLRNIFYDVSKAAVIRMIHGMAHDLRPHRVATVALAPGFMRTERIMAAYAAHPFDLSITESPEYLGRAVRALAEDANVMEKSGGVFTVGDLAREYGFTDVDGRQPAAFRFPSELRNR